MLRPDRAHGGKSMEPIEYLDARCPWCSEMISLAVECIKDAQEYVEECPVCCAPIQVQVRGLETGTPMIELEREGG